MDTEALSLTGGRRVGQPGHNLALEFIEKRMGEEKLSFLKGNSFRLPYKADRQEFCNLAGVIPGSDSALMPVLIGAHYDSALDGPCSDDNAASVAVSLCAGLFRTSDELLLLCFLMQRNRLTFIQRRWVHTGFSRITAGTLSSHRW